MYFEVEDELGKVSTIVPRHKPEKQEEINLRQGDHAPVFFLRNEDDVRLASLSGSGGSGESLSELLVVRPMVLSFYCTCWGNYAPRHLEMLRSLAPKVQALGGQLIVLTHESPRMIERLSADVDYEFPIIMDRGRNVARAYGVYSETSPIWERIAGISEEVFTPALFVIGRDRRVRYTFVDDNFDQSPDLKAVLGGIFDGR